MSMVESCMIRSPYNVDEECAKFSITDVTKQFVFSSVTMPDKVYTFSFWAKSDSDGIINVGNESFETLNEWRRLVVTFTATERDLKMSFGTAGVYYIYHPQLEIGNKATDWTPATEDVIEATNDASRVATNFIEYDESEGLVVGDMTTETLGKNVFINSNGVYIRDGETVLASYGANGISLAKNNPTAEISLCGDLCTLTGYGTTVLDGEITMRTGRGLTFDTGEFIESKTKGYLNGGGNISYDATSIKSYYDIPREDDESQPGGRIDMCAKYDRLELVNEGDVSVQKIVSDVGIIKMSYQYIDMSVDSDYNAQVLIDGHSGVTKLYADTQVRICTPSEAVYLQDAVNDDTYSAYFRPMNDNVCTLGTYGSRWNRVYAGNATIQTSDKRQKKGIKNLDKRKTKQNSKEVEVYSALFDMLEPSEYTFIQGEQRICFGLMAQDVLASMNELGIDENELDLVHHDTWIDEETGEEKDAYGIAYENLIALLIHEVQKLKKVKDKNEK